jgi:TPR repeat protein
MFTPVTHSSSPGPELEIALAAVELRLAALGASLHARDAAGIDLHASELHRALAQAVDHFTRAASAGSLPTALRLRLASASGEVAAQRESLARATAALDRAIDVLLPRESAALYSTLGAAERNSLGGSLLA